MRNFFTYLIISLALSVTTAMVYAKYYLSPRVQEIITAKASEALGTPVQIHDLRLVILPRLSLAASGVKFTLAQPKLKVEIPKIFITAPINKGLFSRTSTFGPIQIKIESPRINLELKSQSANSSATDDSPQTVMKLNHKRDVWIELSVEQARIRITRASANGEIENETSLEPLDIEMAMPGIEKEWQANVRTRLINLHPQLNIPVEIESAFSYDSGRLAVRESSGTFASLPFKLSGEQNKLDRTASWKVVFDIADFSKIKTQFDSLKNLTGGLSAKMTAVLANQSDWQISADLQAKAVTGDINYAKDDIQLKGPLKLDVKLAYQDQILRVSEFKLLLANFRTQISGVLSLKKTQSSDLSIQVPAFDLTPWQKNFSAYGIQPVSGELSAEAKIRSNSIENLVFDIQRINLNKVKLIANYNSTETGLQFDGPISLDTSVTGSYAPSKAFSMSTLNLNGTGNFNLMNLSYVPTKAAPAQKGEPKTSDKHSDIDWSHLKASHFNIVGQSKHVRYDNFSAEDLSFLAGIVDQSVRGEIKTTKMNSGEADLKDIQLDLKKTNPEWNARLSFQNIDAGDFLTSFNADSQSLSGRASGQISLTLAPDYRENLLNALHAVGKVDLKDALIYGRSPDETIREKLSKIPGFQKSKDVASAANTGADINLQFNFARSDLNILDLKILSQAKNELQGKGHLIFPKQEINLNATGFLADSPIGGDIARANSDAQGRLVIPFGVGGTLKDPQINIAPATITEMLRKSLSLSLKKAVAPTPSPTPASTMPTKLPPKVSKLIDQDDSEDSEETPATEDKSKPPQDKVQALKNRLQGIFDKH